MSHGLYDSTDRGFNTICRSMCAFGVVHMHEHLSRVDLLFCLVLLVDKESRVKELRVESQCIHCISTIYGACYMWDTTYIVVCETYTCCI